MLSFEVNKDVYIEAVRPDDDGDLLVEMH